MSYACAISVRLYQLSVFRQDQTGQHEDEERSTNLSSAALLSLEARAAHRNPASETEGARLGDVKS